MSSVDPRLAAIERQYHRQRNWLLVVVLLGVAVNTWFYVVISGPEQPAHALMEFASAGAVGETALCPGDVLSYDVALHVSGPGVFDLDVAVWRVTPPATVLFSSTRRLVEDEPADYVLERRWTVPEMYASSVDGTPERWAAGQYERRHAITTSSRSTVPSIVSIPFEIREDCP